MDEFDLIKLDRQRQVPCINKSYFVVQSRKGKMELHLSNSKHIQSHEAPAENEFLGDGKNLSGLSQDCFRTAPAPGFSQVPDDRENKISDELVCSSSKSPAPLGFSQVQDAKVPDARQSGFFDSEENNEARSRKYEVEQVGENLLDAISNFAGGELLCKVGEFLQTKDKTRLLCTSANVREKALATFTDLPHKFLDGGAVTALIPNSARVYNMNSYYDHPMAKMLVEEENAMKLEGLVGLFSALQGVPEIVQPSIGNYDVLKHLFPLKEKIKVQICKQVSRKVKRIHLREVGVQENVGFFNLNDSPNRKGVLVFLINSDKETKWVRMISRKGEIRHPDSFSACKVGQTVYIAYIIGAPKDTHIARIHRGQVVAKAKLENPYGVFMPLELCLSSKTNLLQVCAGSGQSLSIFSLNCGSLVQEDYQRIKAAEKATHIAFARFANEGNLLVAHQFKDHILIELNSISKKNETIKMAVIYGERYLTHLIGQGPNTFVTEKIVEPLQDDFWEDGTAVTKIKVHCFPRTLDFYWTLQKLDLPSNFYYISSLESSHEDGEHLEAGKEEQSS